MMHGSRLFIHSSRIVIWLTLCVGCTSTDKKPPNKFPSTLPPPKSIPADPASKTEISPSTPQLQPQSQAPTNPVDRTAMTPAPFDPGSMINRGPGFVPTPTAGVPAANPAVMMPTSGSSTYPTQPAAQTKGLRDTLPPDSMPMSSMPIPTPVPPPPPTTTPNSTLPPLPNFPSGSGDSPMLPPTLPVVPGGK